MKRMILFALFLNAAILGVIALELVALAGGDEDPTAAVNGDTNGDGARDIGDAVYLLRWLFNGGDEPVPVACAQAGPVLTAEQAEILSHLSLAQVPIDNQGTLVPTIIITGANLQLVNGMGSSWGDSAGDVWNPSTHRTNGLGNLIIGYQENRTDDGVGDTDDGNYRTGSHNLVVGAMNNYWSWGGLVVGARNAMGGWLSTVAGGYNNIANGEAAVVSGGDSNYAIGRAATVSGGWGNSAEARGSTVCGGGGNFAYGEFSFIGGGRNNTANGDHSVVGGGSRNTSNRDMGFLIGGDNVND